MGGERFSHVRAPLAAVWSAHWARGAGVIACESAGRLASRLGCSSCGETPLELAGGDACATTWCDRRMSAFLKLVLHWPRFGPYHLARAEAAARYFSAKRSEGIGFGNASPGHTQPL